MATRGGASLQHTTQASPSVRQVPARNGRSTNDRAALSRHAIGCSPSLGTTESYKAVLDLPPKT